MRRLSLVIFFCGAALASCKNDSPATTPQRACGLTVWYHASDAAHVEVVGSWNAWARPGAVLERAREDGWRVTSFDLGAGAYSYAIVDDGQWLTDATVPTTSFHDGLEVTWVSVQSCDAPQLHVDGVTATPQGQATVSASFLASRSGDPVDPATLTATARDGSVIAASAFQVDPATGKTSFSVTGLSPGKYVYTLRGADTRGRAADDARATLWIEPRPFDQRDTVIYQIMIDRYRDAGGALRAPTSPAGRAGGTVDGVRAAVESGEIAALGANTLWLSPLYANPDGDFPGADGRAYSSYHGYWPSASRALESLQADQASLDRLISAAHARGIRVLFDVVPHHVHSANPYFAAHRGDGWFQHPDASCICGSPTCDWSTHIEDCWFAPYLPAFDWTDPDAADQATSDVVWWLDTFDGDGVRIDAVPMMPRGATRRIAWEARARYGQPGYAPFMLGENFVGQGGFQLLRYDLGPFGLDSEFHFPLMWTLRSVIAQASGSMADIDASISTGEAAWNGSGAVMSLMIGNHDVSRFSSVSSGDDGGDTWTPAPQSVDPLVYAKQAMALGLTYTLPGAPVVYYGDEIALAGRGDPDCRRVLPPESALSSLQLQTRAAVRALGAARTCLASLRRGSYRLLHADAEQLVFARELAGEDTAVVVASRSPNQIAAVPLPGIAPGMYTDVLSGHSLTITPPLTKIDGAPFSLTVYVPASSACAGTPPSSH